MKKILLLMAALGALALLSEGRIDLTATEFDAIAAREIDAPLPNSSGHWIPIAPVAGRTACEINAADMQQGVTYYCSADSRVAPVVIGGDVH